MPDGMKAMLYKIFRRPLAREVENRGEGGQRTIVMDKNSIAHVFQDNTWYLNRGIVPSICQIIDSACEQKFYLCRAHSSSASVLSVGENAQWIGKIGDLWGGGLETVDWDNRLGWLWAPIRNRMRWLLPAFSFRAWIMIAKGPKDWLFHGTFFNFGTVFLFRMLGKRIAYLNWSGSVYRGKTILSRVDNLKWRLCAAVFVLMSPEIRYFNGLLHRSKIKVLPYPCLSNKVYEKALDNLPEYEIGGLMVGNNALRMKAYPEILDKLYAGEWKKITCMLNYGSGGEWKPVTDLAAFEKKYQEKFGTAWYAWKTVLPYEEYAKVMLQSSIYICPMLIQSGLEALFLSIRQGKTVIVRGDNFLWCKDLGLDVVNMDEIKNFHIESLRSLALTKDQIVGNIKKLEYAYCEKYGPKYWRETVLGCFSA